MILPQGKHSTHHKKGAEMAILDKKAMFPPQGIAYTQNKGGLKWM